MASFDPSIISQIPDYAPNPIAARAQAYKLADIYNEEQLNALRLNEEKKDAADKEAIKGILAKEDLSTPEGIHKAASKLTAGGFPEQGLRLMTTAQQYATGQVQQAKEKNEADLARLKKYSAQMDVAANVFDEIREPLDRAKAAGMPPAMLDEMTRRAIVPAMQRLEQDLPEFSPQIRQFLATPSHLTYSGLVLAEQKTNEGQRLFEQEIRKREVANTERHQQVEEGFRAREVAAKEKEAASFSGDKRLLLGALAERGVSLPAGFRSKDQQAALLQGLLDRNPAKSVDQIADQIKSGQLTFAGEKKEVSTVGGIAGKVEFGGAELREMAPLVLQASAALPRGSFVPITKLLQAGESSISDPRLKTLRIRINSLLNAYDQLAARGGTDKDKRAEVRSLITSADSPAALKAGLDSFIAEADAASRAAQTAMKPPGAAPTKSPNDPLGIR